MVVVYTSDLHGNKEHYQELFELAGQRKAQSYYHWGRHAPHPRPFSITLSKSNEDFIFSYLEPTIEELSFHISASHCLRYARQ